MKKLFFILVTIVAIGIAAPVFAGAESNKEAEMAYCAIADLQDAYGTDRISAWSRMDADTADMAITNASAEIDGYLLSSGYNVPLEGSPATIRKYCVDIACANLIISAGALDSDPGGDAVVEQAKIARRYLEKVAEGKFKIPGYSAGSGETTSGPPAGNVQARSMKRLDLRGYC